MHLTKNVEKARRLHRPSLRNWKCDGLYYKFPAYLDDIEKRDKYESFILNQRSSTPRYTEYEFSENIINIPVVIDSKSTSPHQFIESYESRKVPTVICGIPNGHRYDDAKWPALERWKIENLESNPDIYRQYFKVGEDDDGETVKLKLKYFLKYMDDNKDDSPLYVFDSSFDEDKYAKTLLDDFSVPSYFNEDLLHLVGESRRPPYRWFLIGPQRSGTTVHIDPLGTSAWNTLLSGKKRWVLFPPHIPKRVVKGTGLIRKGEDDEAIHYFMYILPRIKEKAARAASWRSSSGDNDKKSKEKEYGYYENFRCYEFTQCAGETVFIPNGWWHAVLNLTHTVGVTQNFCSHRNFDQVWVKSRTGRKRMAWKWMCRLDEKYPHLAHRARELNKRDNFMMKYDPVEIRKREIEKERESRRIKKTKKTVKDDRKSKSRNKGEKSATKTSKNSSSSMSSTSYKNEAPESGSKKRRIVSPCASP